MGSSLEQATIKLELQLAGWSETHTGGCKVTFWLNDASDLDVFRAMTVRKGGVAGQVFMAALVEVGDDGKPIRQEPTVGPLCQSALVICRDEAFQAFVESNPERMREAEVKGRSREQCAGDYIKAFCGIDTRKKLDSDSRAAALFARLMALYREWRLDNWSDQ